MAATVRVRTRWFPLYSAVKDLLALLTGVSKEDVADLLRDVWDKAGTYAARVDWSEPDNWIPQKLSGASARLAWRIWHGSRGRVNPRHIYGAYLFITHYDLAKADSHGVFGVTEQGEGFLEDRLTTLAALDQGEGLLFLLNRILMQDRPKRGDLIPEWAEFLHENSEWKGPEMVRDSLRRRLANLVGRGFVSRQAGVYAATDTGLQYLSKITSIQADPKAKVLHEVFEHNMGQREALKQRVAAMSPRGFEFFVAELLDAMGYKDVQVTEKSHDKGVDIKATSLVGTTPIRQVFQVKHWTRNVGVRVLRELRGSLPHHNATLGTIVTIGKFSRDCIEASSDDWKAPIGLIDGDELVELLFKYNVGIQRTSVDLYELDSDALDELSKEPGDATPSEQ